MPLFSLIMPCRDAAHLIGPTLDSLRQQTETDWEVICVNDGSTDKTLATLMGYAAQDARIRVVHQARAGGATARESGMAVAHGAWVAFLRPGVVWAAGHLHVMRRAMQQDTAAAALHQPTGTATGDVVWRADGLTPALIGAETDFGRLADLRASGGRVHVTSPDGAHRHWSITPLPQTVATPPVETAVAA